MLFLVLFLGILGGNWYVYLGIPYKIIRMDDETLEFRSLLRQETLSPQDIISIRGVFLGPGFIRIRHTEGSMLLWDQMTGLHELIAHLRQANPAITVSGC